MRRKFIEIQEFGFKTYPVVVGGGATADVIPAADVVGLLWVVTFAVLPATTATTATWLSEATAISGAVNLATNSQRISQASGSPVLIARTRGDRLRITAGTNPVAGYVTAKFMRDR